MQSSDEDPLSSIVESEERRNHIGSGSGHFEARYFVGNLLLTSFVAAARNDSESENKCPTSESFCSEGFHGMKG